MWLFHLTYKLRIQNAKLQEERNMYKRAYLECNTQIKTANEIIAGDSAKTLIYW